jgi:hypothetical protein
MEKLEQKVLAANGIQRGAANAPAPTPEGSKPGKAEAEQARAVPNGAAKPGRAQPPARPS